MYTSAVKARISSSWFAFLQNVLQNKYRKPDSDLFMQRAKDYSEETFSTCLGSCSAFLNLYPYSLLM